MASYTVNATVTVEVTNPSALAAFGGGDERAGIESAVQAGLRELPGIARRYGFRVTGTSASVDPA